MSCASAAATLASPPLCAPANSTPPRRSPWSSPTPTPTSPGASPITIRVTGDQTSGRLLGAQLIGARDTETAKRVDIYATALHHGMTVAQLSDLDLSYTPPVGSPWDAVQAAAQAWVRDHQLADQHATPRGERLAT
jgi:pyridine nucleotide-disulfide oxidoreductase